MEKKQSSMPSPGQPYRSRHGERGAILFVALILLMVLTMLGFTALRTATMQERMSGTLRDRGIAFQAAESALRAAEKYLGANSTFSAATFNGTTCTAGVFKLDANGVPYLLSQDKSLSSGIKWDGSNPDFWNEWPWAKEDCYSVENVSYVSTDDYGKPGRPTEKPRYVIEEITKDGLGRAVYRVTALGYGSSKNAVVILQATYTQN